jgi:hypothetical protein
MLKQAFSRYDLRTAFQETGNFVIARATVGIR